MNAADEDDVVVRCYKWIGHAHAQHPMRRTFLGPMPATLVSDEALQWEAQRRGLRWETDAQSLRSLRDTTDQDSFVLLPRSSLRRRRSRLLRRTASSTPQMRGDARITSLLGTIPESPTSEQSAHAEPPRAQPMSPADEAPDAVTTASLAASPRELQHRRGLTHRHAAGEPTRDHAILRGARTEAIRDDASVARGYRPPRLPWPRRHGRRGAVGAPATPSTLDPTSYFMTASLPSVPSLSSTIEEHLQASEREALIDALATTVSHRKVIGDSFEVGRLFFELAWAEAQASAQALDDTKVAPATERAPGAATPPSSAPPLYATPPSTAPPSTRIPYSAWTSPAPDHVASSSRAAGAATAISPALASASVSATTPSGDADPSDPLQRVGAAEHHRRALTPPPSALVPGGPARPDQAAPALDAAASPATAPPWRTPTPTHRSTPSDLTVQPAAWDSSASPPTLSTTTGPSQDEKPDGAPAPLASPPSSPPPRPPKSHARSASTRSRFDRISTWQGVQETLEDEALLKTRRGPPSQAMQRLEEEMVEARHRLTDIVAGASLDKPVSASAALTSAVTPPASDSDSFVSASTMDDDWALWPHTGDDSAPTAAPAPAAHDIRSASAPTPAAPSFAVTPVPQFVVSSADTDQGARADGPSAPPATRWPPPPVHRRSNSSVSLESGRLEPRRPEPPRPSPPRPSPPRPSPSAPSPAMGTAAWHTQHVQQPASLFLAPRPARRRRRFRTPSPTPSLTPGVAWSDGSPAATSDAEDSGTERPASLTSLDPEAIEPSEMLEPAAPSPVDGRSVRTLTSAMPNRSTSSLHAEFRSLTQSHQTSMLPTEPDILLHEVPVGPGDAPPRPVDEVLSRRVNAPVPVPPPKMSPFAGAPILCRDRLLVKFRISHQVDIDGTMDVLEARRYDLRTYPWSEYLVVLRPGRFELWSEATMRGRLLGDRERYKLRFARTLRRNTTTVSMYSEVDRLLCLTFAHCRAGMRGRLPFRRHGTTVLILNARTLSLASDWMWLLWRELGGRLPSHLHVSVPDIATRVRMPLPPADTLDLQPKEYDAPPRRARGDIDAHSDAHTAYEKMMASHIIVETQRLVERTPQWAPLAQDFRQRGIKPALMWRSGVSCNWIQYDTTVQGAPRFWNALVGSLIANHRIAPTLEMVIQNHYPSAIYHPRGFQLHEPSAVEGFVLRFRPMLGSMTRVYLSLHDSYLFLLRDHHAFPPDRATGAPLRGAPQGPPNEHLRTRISQFEAYERSRHVQQIKHADGFVDLSDVCAVGSIGTEQLFSTELAAHSSELLSDVIDALPELEQLHDYDGTRAALERRLSLMDDSLDHIDPQPAAFQRATARTMRQFVLFLKNGRRIIFECASAALAREWIIQLFQHAVFWRCRHMTEARCLMDVEHFADAKAGHGRAAEVKASRLSLLWNWCPLLGCRPISFHGPLFWRAGARRPFHRCIFVLCDGELLSFKLVQSQRTSSKRQNEGLVYRRKGPSLSLRDAYVYIAALADRTADVHANDTQSSRHQQSRHELHDALPRLYRNGLSSMQSNEDCSFVLRVRSDHDRTPFWSTSSGADGQTLSSQLKEATEITFRARTTIERNIWVRLIGAEIEKLVRRDPDHEERVRQFGRVP